MDMNTTGITSGKTLRPRIFEIWFALFLAMAWGHWGLTPVTDFVADDWGYLGYGTHHTAGEIFRDTIRDYYRPVNILVNRLLFMCPGDSPVFFSMACIALHGGILALYLCLLRRLFGTRQAMWIGGALYAFAPIFHEMFHWANMVAILYYPLAMLGAIGLWAGWTGGRSGAWAFAVSLLCYAVAVLTYENCVPLCLLFPLYAALYADKRRMRWSWAYAGLAALYAVYRFTHGFGMGQAAIHGGSYFGEGEGLGIVALLQNARTVLSWWMGGLGARSFTGGFDSFFMLKPKWQFAFTAISLALLLGIARSWTRKTANEENANEAFLTADCNRKGLVFGLAWAALSYAPHLLFPAASRHHMIPIFGIGMVFAAMAGLRKPKTPAWAWIGIGLLCLIANAGNGLAWKEAGVFCRRLYRHLDTMKEQWKDKQLVLFDTLALRERQTPGVTSLRDDAPSTWAEYRNAILLRGFVGTGMLEMCLPNPPKGIQDTECGIKIEGATLFWHERFNPSAARETPMADVHRIDVLAAAIDVL